jgi:outer membrane biosynthesis protein TonB
VSYRWALTRPPLVRVYVAEVHFSFWKGDAMTFKRILLSASAAMLLILPAVSFAADNQENDQHPADQGRPQRQTQPQQEQAQPQQEQRPQRQAQPQQEQRPQQQASPQPQGRRQQQASFQQQGSPQQQIAKPEVTARVFPLATSSSATNGVPAMLTGTAARSGNAIRTGGAGTRPSGTIRAHVSIFSTRPATATTTCRRNIRAVTGTLARTCHSFFCATS